MSDPQTKEKAKEVYEMILTTALKFLSASKRFRVNILKDNDPTFESIADLAVDLAEIIGALASDFDPMLHQKALDYSNLMKKMGAAINDENQEALDLLTKELEAKPFL